MSAPCSGVLSLLCKRLWKDGIDSATAAGEEFNGCLVAAAGLGKHLSAKSEGSQRKSKQEHIKNRRLE